MIKTNITLATLGDGFGRDHVIGGDRLPESYPRHDQGNRVR